MEALDHVPPLQPDGTVPSRGPEALRQRDLSFVVACGGVKESNPHVATPPTRCTLALPIEERAWSMKSEPRYVWLRHGDHRLTLDQAIAACAAEYAGNAVGLPTVVMHRDGDGNVFTGLEAGGAWWVEYMRVHAKGWTGPISRDQASDILDPQPPLGGEG